MNNIKVFVYGSLKQGFGNHGCLRGSDYVGTDTLTGDYKMVSLGGFPGVTHSDGEHTIHGEVYNVDLDGLAALDCLEGNGSFYTRARLRLDSDTECWVYLLPYDEYGHMDPILTGVWEESWNVAYLTKY